MLTAFSLVMAVHGLLHLLGFAKAFGMASLPQLTVFISRPMGLLWLVAALALLSAAVALHAAPRWWWAMGAVALLLSQVSIASSWADAQFGTLANVLVLAGVVLGALATGPWSLKAEYEREVERGLARTQAQPPVTEADLVALPMQVQRYLRRVGVLGQPRVQSLRVGLTGRMRGGPDQPWMKVDAEQHSFFGPNVRLFFMTAQMKGVPVVGLHRYVGAQASMRIKVLSAFSMVDASGEPFTATETVTLFNDMCVLAPATLIDPSIRWQVLDAQRVIATWTNAGHTISATLIFNADGEMVNFHSDDRPSISADFKSFVPMRWSTPLGPYHPYGPFHLAASAEVRYQAPAGEYAYGQFELIEVVYNPSP